MAHPLHLLADACVLVGDESKSNDIVPFQAPSHELYQEKGSNGNAKEESVYKGTLQHCHDLVENNNVNARTGPNNLQILGRSSPPSNQAKKGRRVMHVKDEEELEINKHVKLDADNIILNQTSPSNRCDNVKVTPPGKSTMRRSALTLSNVERFGQHGVVGTPRKRRRRSFNAGKITEESLALKRKFDLYRARQNQIVASSKTGMNDGLLISSSSTTLIIPIGRR